eukprot:366000-Chlamydomonas_euryale.AAC.2
MNLLAPHANTPRLPARICGPTARTGAGRARNCPSPAMLRCSAASRLTPVFTPVSKTLRFPPVAA